jgi:hypothetical protein
MKRIVTTSILIAGSFAFAPDISAQSADSSAALIEAHAGFVKRTESRFGRFAGSEANADRLANGLRNATAITLTGSGERTTFTPPTKPMGYGNVTRSLDLAQRQLAANGITNPTPTEIRTALMGGTLTGPDGSTHYDGVLQLRSDGMGWGRIAHTIGVHPGMGKTAAARAPVPVPTPHVAPRPVSSGVTTAMGARPAGVYGNAHARGNSGNVKVASAAPSVGTGTAAGASTAAGAATAAGGNAFGKGNAFGHTK